MTKLHLLILFATAASCVAPVSQARDGERSRATLRPFCSVDYTRLCDGLDPNGPEVVACFRKNARAVSPGCRAAIADYAGTASEGAAASQ